MGEAHWLVALCESVGFLLVKAGRDDQADLEYHEYGCTTRTAPAHKGPCQDPSRACYSASARPRQPVPHPARLSTPRGLKPTRTKAP